MDSLVMMVNLANLELPVHLDLMDSRELLGFLATMVLKEI